MYCSKCGKEIEEGAVFCGYCGTRIETDEAPKQQATPPVQPATPTQSVSQSVNPQIQQQTKTVKQAQQAPKKKNATVWIVLAIVLGVILLIGMLIAVVIGVIVVKNKKADRTQDITTEMVTEETTEATTTAEGVEGTPVLETVEGQAAGYEYDYWLDTFSRISGPSSVLTFYGMDDTGVMFSYGMGMSGYRAMIDIRDCKAEWTDETRTSAIYTYPGTDYKIQLYFDNAGFLSINETGTSPFEAPIAGDYLKSTEIDTANAEYVFPNSNSEYLSDTSCEGLTALECRIARNEIYARHGRKFDDESLQGYFDGCSWYSGTIEPSDFSDDMLNMVERDNLKVIKVYEESMGY